MKNALPTKHLSARVPWHDNYWNGTFCCNVLDNSFCRILPRIDSNKNPDNESNGQKISETNFPPCIAEKGTFLSPYEYIRELPHAWTGINPLYKDYLPAKYHHKRFSFNAVPFLWMMKGTAKDNHYSEKAHIYELDYKADLEQEIDEKLGFEGNTWVQHPHNQKVLLNAFFGCLRKRESLVFFYAKHTPLSEPNERIIVGVAKVREIGGILNYEFPKDYKGYRSHPWDRCVEHTLTDDNPEGFLLPYHDLIEYSKTNEIDLHEFAASAPDYAQYSYASQLVEHDTAIDSLLRIAEVLRKSGSVLGRTFKKELEWIDSEISKIWDMRGAFPGMGPVLSAIKIAEGNSIAWEIEKNIIEKDRDLLKTNPWNIFEESVKEPEKHLKNRGEKLFNKTTQRIWKSLPQGKKEFYILLSRIQLNNDQAKIIISEYENRSGTIDEILSNPYLIYEKMRFYFKGLVGFSQIDKAIMPPVKIAEAFPFNKNTAMSDNLDERRVRAFSVMILEEAADEGHSLLPFGELLERMNNKVLDESFPINEDILRDQSKSDFFSGEVIVNSEKMSFLKLQRLKELKDIITQRINKAIVDKKQFGITCDWLSLINNHPDMPQIDSKADDYDDELLARQEKAEALRVLCNYRVSVLIGPAGSGKTTLLKIFEEIPGIKNGGVIKLSPTGKARVKLGHNAKTIAQFLYPHRYDGDYGIYWVNEGAEKTSSARNVIIDECSMLTEEQLGAIFDALGPVDRIILVGDYRQLPPIGTGRTFVDIVNLLTPVIYQNKQIKVGPGYAELCQIRRQKKNKTDRRYDVILSRCFGDEPHKNDIEIFQDLASGAVKSDHIRLEKWYDSKDFKAKFEKVIQEELGLGENDVIKEFNRTLGAKDIGNYQYFNYDDAEKKIENWQIISPVNGYGYGVKEVNKFIQTTYRKAFIDLALNVKCYKRQIPKPKGADNFVYGDKVISLKNTTWRANQWIKPQQKKPEALNYFANGELGVITGEFRGRNSMGKGEPNVEISFSTQPGYSYVFWPDDLGEDGKYPFELAYAITVHKAQGSGFKKVFFVLPSTGSILCRELLYTALTRQEEKIIILHQGEFRDFIRFAGTEASATARRFTDLFFLPEVRQVEKKHYDARYINVSERGEKMISKNEVIIANCLNKYKKQISYAYEGKLTLGKSGRTIKPDFTIEHLGNGRVFYWEHLGMMTNEEYRNKWQKKKQGYMEEGFVLFEDASIDDDKVLITTEENPNGGIDSQYFDQIVRKYILAEK